MLEILQHEHADELIALSGSCLERKESLNNLPYGLAHTLARDEHYYGPESPLLLSVLEDGEPVGVAVRTPPRRIVLSVIDTDVEKAVDYLVRFLQENSITVPGVIGPENEARCFAETWTRAFPAASAKISAGLRVFEARSVVDVPLAPGRLRLAKKEDTPLMAEWLDHFAVATAGSEPDPEGARNKAEKFIKEEKLYIWDHDGPVSIAMESRPMKHGTVISLVYTPRDLRSRGYATSCVYALTKRLLSSGHSFCSLYTDLANPIANHIYPWIGYSPLGDSLQYDFETADSQVD